MTRFPLFLLGGVSMLAACATQSEPIQTVEADHSQEIRAALGIANQPDLGAFEISLTNQGSEPFCLAVGDWPNQDIWGKEATPRGSLNNASAWVTASVNGERFPVENENLGYCAEGPVDLQGGSSCHIMVRPGETQTAILPFARFPGLLQASTQGDPVLSYNPTLTPCG